MDVAGLDRSSTRRAFRVVPLVLLLLAAASCGGSGGPAATSTSVASRSDATVSMTDWRFGPSELTVTGSDSISLEIRNNGAILHEWALLTSRIESEAEFQDDLVIARLAVQSGQTRTVSFELPPPGTYQFVCPIPGHIAEGMVGTLIVAG